jgi:PAS domain S-box-containing protein
VTKDSKSIRHKLNRVLALTTLMALLIAAVAIGALDLRTRTRSIEDDAITQADVLALANVAALEFDDKRAAAENLRVLRANAQVAVAAVYDENGRLFASYASASADSAPPESRQATNAHSLDLRFLHVWRPVASKNGRLGTIYVEAEHRLVARGLEYLAVMAVIVALSLAAALAISDRMQRSITEPILSMGAIARRVTSERTFTLRARESSDDELGELAKSFNAMLDELGTRAKSLESAINALRVSDERYKLVMRGSSAGLWDWDVRTDTVFYAPRLRELLGYDVSEFPDVADSMRRIMHPDDRESAREALRQHLSNGLPFAVESRLRPKSGEWRWFQLTGMAEKDAEGRAFRMAGSVIDVTERKQVEQALQESSRAKDEFIATLAHELRNPLAPIRTGLEILKRDTGNGPVAARARETMERQLAHMVRLIDDLLEISRISSGKIRIARERVQLSQAIAAAIEISRPMIDARHHRFDVEPAPREIEMFADGTRIAQCLGNLLHNAAKYTPEGGRIGLRALQEGAWAVIEVSDTGVGIPEAMLEQVFSIFTQVGRTLDRSQGGLGIGLYLVRSLVELHGGTVVARSAGVGQGSTFTVRLPCLPEPQQPSRPLPADEPGSAASNLKVLVVDDNVDAADTLTAMLELTGCEARSVNEGKAVLPAAREFGPDVILLDIGLPDISGYEVARRLRADEELGRVHVVAVTGWGAEDDRRKSQEAGFDEHLTKPVELASLQAIFARLAGERAGTQAGGS